MFYSVEKIKACLVLRPSYLFLHWLRVLGFIGYSIDLFHYSGSLLMVDGQFSVALCLVRSAIPTDSCCFILQSTAVFDDGVT